MVTGSEWVILSKRGCYICGRKEPKVVLERAHLRASHKGGQTVVPMCSDHHRKYDKGLLSDSQLKKLGITRRQYGHLRPLSGRRSKKSASSGKVSVVHQTSGRRKLVRNELKLYVEMLSAKDSEAKAEALKQLANMAFIAAIETDEELLPNLTPLISDENLNVRRAALYLFERLSWRISTSYRTRYNKILIPLIVNAALQDEDVEVKKNAIEGLVASKERIAVEVFVKLVTTLPEEQYKRVILDNTWSNLVYNGFGPQLRQELAKAFERGETTVRQRISKETEHRNLG